MKTNSFGSKDENLAGMTGIDTTMRARNSDRDIETPCLIAPGSGAERNQPLSMRNLEWMSEDSPSIGSKKIKKTAVASLFRMGSERSDSFKGNSPNMGENSLGVITPKKGDKSGFENGKSPAPQKSITFSN
jgi:hypothetical protein